MCSHAGSRREESLVPFPTPLFCNNLTDFHLSLVSLSPLTGDTRLTTTTTTSPPSSGKQPGDQAKRVGQK